MYLTLVFLPFLGSSLALLGGRWLGSRGAGLYTTTLLMSSAVLSWIAVYEVGYCGSICVIKGASWMESEIFDATWGWCFDPLSVIMCAVVTSVSSLVHLYATAYMEEDPHLPRFMAYLSIFTFFMLILVTSDNYLQLFLGWEGIGLASFLLINFWFTRLQANKAGIKAMIVNRVGDLGLALGMFGLFASFKSLDFATIFACVPGMAGTPISFWGFNLDLLTLLACFLFVGVLGKSAQFGLHTWLPDAMEGPTPVSALIHAATLVTAGVFLIARSSIIFEHSPFALIVLSIFGGITCFFAATTGVVQNDLKRVIAYSTCSQLGYMVFICGLSGYGLSIFHLMNHAFFKALLFLTAGALIHGFSDEQDMRKLGGLVRLIPMTYGLMTIGSLALVGFPFLAGFYSKEAILEVGFANYSFQGSFAYWLGSLSVFCTSYYSFRLLILGFLAPMNGLKSSTESVHDAPWQMGLPFILLGIGSLTIGYFAKDLMIGGGTGFWSTALFTLPINTIWVESEVIPQTIKFIPLIFTLLGARCAWFACVEHPQWFYHLFIDNPFLRTLYLFFNRRWLVDKVYNDWLVSPSLSFGYNVSFKALDKGVLEELGPQGIPILLNQAASILKTLQTGLIYHYAFMILLGLTFFLSVGTLEEGILFTIQPGLGSFLIGSYFVYHFFGGSQSHGNLEDVNQED